MSSPGDATICEGQGQSDEIAVVDDAVQRLSLGGVDMSRASPEPTAKYYRGSQQ